MSGVRRRAMRAALSALAGGGLTAVGLGAALPSAALGVGVPAGPPISTDGSAAPLPSSQAGAEAQQTGAGISTGTSTTPSSSPSSSSTPATSSSPTAATGPASSVPHAGAPEAGGASDVPVVRLQRRQRTTAAPKRGRKPTHARPRGDRRRTRGPHSSPHATATGHATATRHNLAPPPQLAADRLRALTAQLAFSGASARALAYYRIPLFLLPIYQAAAIQYGVPWQILAAINEVETDYGADLSVSTAGAVGWMQFMPATWMQYGVDALNAGYADPYNPVDAIFAAARYLRAAGAAHNLGAAIFAYNHSDEYVSSVLLRAKLISTYPKPVIATLTSLADGRLPLTGGHVAWEALHPRTSSSPSTATANAKALAPAAAAAAATGLDAGQLVDVRGARTATVVAAREGRIVGLGSSRKLGSYVLLRDLHGDLFTYSGLGGVAASYIVAKTSHKSTGARYVRLPLRRGSFVKQGAVLGRVREPIGAKDGHLLFAIRPAGDRRDVDPRPILANWARLAAALHPWRASVQVDLLQATAGDFLVLSKSRLQRDLNRISIGLHPTAAAIPLTATKAATGARSASSGRSSRSPLPVSGDLSIVQWDRLIVHIAALRAPIVAVRPSSWAIGDAGQREDEW